MDLKFRSLKADEIDCRVAMVKKDGSGLSLLLYKDARVDQNILDETVGPMNWQRRHTRDNANCIVSLWDAEKCQWVEKEDTGTESNTEAEKGLASDSFKRACFNWGIGRELYTAPFIWISADKCGIKDGRCYDRFRVSRIKITDGRILELEIINQSRKGAVVFSLGGSSGADKPEPMIDEAMMKTISEMAYFAGVNLTQALNGAPLGNLTMKRAGELLAALKERAEKNGSQGKAG